MDPRHQASRCRQQIAEALAQLEPLARVLLGHEPILRASLYEYRRRCGAPGCRCARGQRHVGRALAVSTRGRSRTIPLGGLNEAHLRRHVQAYRQWRGARARMVKVFGRVLEAVDRLGRLRTVGVERLRDTRRRAG